jgi:hypothetical protein
VTVIAYRSGVMACDSCWASNGTQNVSATKIIRLSSGGLLGSAGDNDIRALVNLVDKIRSPSQLPSRRSLAETRISCEALLAFKSGDVWMISTGGHDDAGYPIDDDADYGCWPAATIGGYAAAGSGADYALAAMDAGASARQAVEIACRRNIHCRLPVHTVKLLVKSK